MRTKVGKPIPYLEFQLTDENIREITDYENERAGAEKPKILDFIEVLKEQGITTVQVQGNHKKTMEIMERYGFSVGHDIEMLRAGVKRGKAIVDTLDTLTDTLSMPLDQIFINIARNKQRSSRWHA